MFLRGCAKAADEGQLGVEMGKLMVNGQLMREAADELEKLAGAEVVRLLPKVYEDEFEEFLDNLQAAERSAQQALNMLYPVDTGVQRGLAYRLRLGNAQSILMTLLVREINRKDNKLTGGAHDWEHVDANVYECVYCERRATPTSVGKKLVFVPDVLRRVPKLGQKYRCPN